MKKIRRNLTGLMIAGVALALLFAACEPMEGSFESILEKVSEANKGGDDGPKTCTVTFHNNGGEGDDRLSATVDPGSYIILPGGDGLTKADYTFGGWNTLANGNGTNYDIGFSYPVTVTITLYAKWNADCIVTFSGNGQSTGSPPLAVSKPAGAVIQLPGDNGMTKASHVFGGWNTLANGSGTNYRAGDSYTITGTTTLHAKWNAACTVEFNPNGGGGGSLESPITVGMGEALLLPGASGLTKPGSSFNGWNTQANGEGTNYPANFPYTINAPYTVFFAKWGNTSTVEYDLNGGTGTTPPSQTVNLGYTVTISDDSNFSRAGTNGGSAYNFAGWNTNREGTGTDYTPGNIYQPTANITLYAKWTSTVKYDLNSGGGTVPATETVNAGSGISLPPGSGLTRDGYTFRGWSLSASGEALGASYTPTGNITLYVKWSHRVQFTANGGAPEPADQFIDNGKPASQPATMTRAGTSGSGDYSFDGWYSDPGFAATTKWTFATAVTANMTLHARWTSTVTFDSDGGGSAIPSVPPVTAGSSITLPGQGSLTRRGYTFGGWSTTSGGAALGASYTPTGNITLYARWNELNDPVGSTLALKLDWIAANARTGGDYTITVSAEDVAEALAPRTLLSGTGYTSYKVTLIATAARTINLPVTTPVTTGSLFTINSGVTLTLGNNITLQGHSNNIASLVRVNSDSTLVMKSGSKITGNTTTSYGGGVYVTGTNCSFTMSGDAAISGNTASSNGGGVYVAAGGTFTMSGSATISGNKATSTSNGGGGVYVTNGTFTMSDDATISGNTATANGGGVFVTGSGSFTMSGDTVISGNTATTSGGGVYVYNNATFTMSGGTIGGSTTADANTAVSGGGVYVNGSGSTLTMSGDAVISGNTASSGAGGGVYVGNGAFTMSSGTIFGNTTTSSGGGVFVSSGTFTMSDDAIISGNKSTGSSSSDGGGGVYVTNGTFTMSDGTISDNSATSSGGGVYVSGSSTFTMKTGATITGNTANSSSYGGGGVLVTGSAATFDMAGGTISGNISTGTGSVCGGGGVYVASSGTFSMGGGSISGNIATSYGGGVYMSSGTFTMDGGTIGGSISGNIATSYGGGVYVNNASFTMSGSAAISGNSASSAGGVYVATTGTFTMSGTAAISGNTVTAHGGGTYVYGGSFTMNGGTISGNKASASGGGVFAYSGNTTMNGGTIFGNTAGTSGGGVWVNSTYAKFTKTGATGGGTINGYTSGVSSSNVVGTLASPVSNMGHAVYASSTYHKEITAGPTVPMGYDPAASPVASGDWNN